MSDLLRASGAKYLMQQILECWQQGAIPWAWFRDLPDDEHPDRVPSICETGMYDVIEPEEPGEWMKFNHNSVIHGLAVILKTYPPDTETYQAALTCMTKDAKWWDVDTDLANYITQASYFGEVVYD